MLSFATEVCAYMKTRKKYWLAPPLAMMALLGGLLAATHGTAVAPFLYSIF